jgi:hypothetical protein
MSLLPRKIEMRFHIACPRILSLVLTLAFPSTGQSAQASHLQTEALVRQIDHILIGSDHAEDVFRLFSEKLGLPVAWPFESYKDFASGGVSFGNVNIEITRSERFPSGLSGVALEPTSLSEVLSGLDAHGLKHRAPNPYFGKDSSGSETLWWTTVGLTSLSPANTIFFCKYNFDIGERRADLLADLQKHEGGPLGIEAVKELVIGVKDMAAARHDWSILLGSVPPGQEPLWQIGSGPAIRLVAGKEDRLLLLRVRVKSLEHARAFLKAGNLLGLDAGHEISLDSSHIAGADVRLVE